MHGLYSKEYLERCNPKLLSSLLSQAWEMERERKAWEQYLQLYPYMMVPSSQTQGNKPILSFKPFTEFYSKMKGEISTRSSEEILEEARKIREAVGQGQ